MRFFHGVAGVVAVMTLAGSVQAQPCDPANPATFALALQAVRDHGRVQALPKGLVADLHLVDGAAKTVAFTSDSGDIAHLLAVTTAQPENIVLAVHRRGATGPAGVAAYLVTAAGVVRASALSKGDSGARIAADYPVQRQIADIRAMYCTTPNGLDR